LFTIFKKKTYLRDLIPNGYTDIHSHILYGIDDGAATADDTISLVKQLNELGFSDFIATPHTMQHVWENTTSSIQSRLLESNEVLKENGLPFRLRGASEYLIDTSFAERFKKETLLTLKDNYVLVEMSYLNAPIQLMEILFELQVAGYAPVLAHPERYIFYHHNYAQYKKLKDAGCKFQVNLLSTTGYYGPAVAKLQRN
jgi:protein-tyrosine phosphatase